MRIRRCYDCHVDMKPDTTAWVWRCPHCDAIQKYYAGELRAYQRRLIHEWERANGLDSLQ